MRAEDDAPETEPEVPERQDPSAESAPRLTGKAALRLPVILFISAIVLFVHSMPAERVEGVPMLVARLFGLAVAPLVVALVYKRQRGAGLIGGVYGVAFIHLLFGVSGGVDSPLQPLVYAWVAMAAAMLSPLAAVVTGATAVAVDVLQWFSGAAPAVSAISHVGFMAVFAALFAMLVRAEVMSLRHKHSAALDDALQQVERDAKDFRLSVPVMTAPGDSVVPKHSPEDEKRRRWVGSVRAIREAVNDVLELARLCTDAEGVLFFALDDEGRSLTLKAAAPLNDAPSSIDRPLEAAEGAVGAVIRTRAPVRLLPKDGGRRIGHPAQRHAKAFVGVPLIAGDQLRGVLTAHRTEARAFTEEDEQRLEAIGREVLRAVESERIFVVMDRARHEQERFYEAFALLNEAMTVDRVAECLLDAAAKVRPMDFGAVTLYDADAETHTVLRVRSDRPHQAERIQGTTYPNKEGGLVAMALKNGHPLPFVPLSRRTERAPHQVFGGADGLELRAVKVFPLYERDVPLGSLVVGSTSSDDQLTAEEERMIETIAAHAAITLAHARMYRRMEMMATTDALTGLVNRRRFNDLLDEALARAERFARSVSVVMVDADHFKRINDTHGHPVGDLVLRRIASLLSAEARRTDVVGRYGGEEFIVLLDETEAAGARQVAERMRERIAREVIQGEFGRLDVTVSMGVATRTAPGVTQRGPDLTRDALVDLADKALYEAKQTGRNKVVSAGRPRAVSGARL